MKHKKFADLPITTKLQRLQAVTVGLALLFTLLVTSVTQVWQARQEKLLDAAAIGKIIGFNASAALLFDDAQSGRDILASLRGKPDILSAQIYDAHGVLFANYAFSNRNINYPRTLRPEDIKNQQPEFQLLRQVMINPIRDRNDTLGMMRLVIDLRPMWWNLIFNLGQIFAVVMAAYVISLIYGRRLSRQIALPLIRLSELAEQVSTEKDYQVRATGEGRDEIGQLVKSFNQMIGQVQARDIDLENQREWLEQEVEHRTIDLRLAMEEAQAASIAKSQFLATMSHEIRTPMNGVLGMTELLMKTGLNERQGRLVNRAYRSAESLLGIINNILDFSKIEAGKLQLHNVDFDVRTLLEETIALFAEQAYRKGIELILNIPCDFNKRVHADSERLRQILVNLLGNAIKFTIKGEVQLKLSPFIREEEEGGIDLLIEIIDTGPGIALEKQDCIFESFTQQDGAITRSYGGTGLGLTISRQLVELMGGRLGVKSTVGHGTSFFFTLNLTLALQPDSVKEANGELNGIDILVVDDNATNRSIIECQLRHWGARVTCAGSASEALKLLHHGANQKSSYQIALLDWHLPAMDGLALAKSIKADPALSDLPLIMLSSESVGFEQETCEHYGICYFLDKPVFQRDLIDRLMDVLGEKPVPKTYSPPAVASGRRIKPFTYRILVAEDNQVNQEVAKGFLDYMGCRTDIVSNGWEAVEAVKANDYDLILMDCHMPELDGFAATDRIRQHQLALDKHRTPIIALTADVRENIKDQCQKAGMDSYLSKPFDLEQLTRVIKPWLPAIQENQADNSVVKDFNEDNTFTSEVIDRQTLLNLNMIIDVNGVTLLEKIIKTYLQTAPIIADEMKSAILQKHENQLCVLAHSLKSASTHLGAKLLAATCLALETAAINHDLSLVNQIYSDFEDQFQQLRHALQSQLELIKTKTGNQLLEKPEQVRPNTGSESGCKILVVDDDDFFRLITSDVLRSAGYNVVEAGSGYGAVEKVNSFLPDLIILDAVMDGLDGFETCKLLRANPVMMDVPIIMSTGLDDVESVNHAFIVGASDFIVKPVNYTILQYHIQFLLRSSRDTAELRGIKQQLIAAQRIARIGYWIWYVEQGKFVASPYLAELCGIDLGLFDEALDSFITLIHPEDRLKVEDAIYSALAGESIASIEYRLNITDEKMITVRQETVLMAGSYEKIVTGTVQDVSEQKETEKLIHQLAYYDELTGLASRAYYQERIDQIIKSAKRGQEEFALLYLDIDEFKYVNDSFGHNVGDQFLKAIAHRIKEVIREVDFAARLGGDEFCIIVDNINDDFPASEIADRCLQEINKPVLLDSHFLKPRVSIGIAIYPQDGVNEHDLMKAADAAMYSAKNSGKQRYAYFRPEMTSSALKRLQDEHLLREAIEHNEFILYYQPQVNTFTGSVTGTEALLRWRHPTLGLVGPVEFIALAENLGLIQKIGNWVLRTACEQVIKWHQQGMPMLQMAVNISPVHFRDMQLVETVREIIHEMQLPPHLLVLEVTENVMQAQGNLDIFSELKKLGLKIAIDDFGTGYSSLGSLKKLPIDCLKIDRTFVHDLLHDAQTPVLLSAIINISKAMNYDIVAEGVETLEQLHVLRDHGCDTFQGYFFSNPVPAEELPMLINKGFTLNGGQTAGYITLKNQK